MDVSILISIKPDFNTINLILSVNGEVLNFFIRESSRPIGFRNDQVRMEVEDDHLASENADINTIEQRSFRGSPHVRISHDLCPMMRWNLRNMCFMIL